MMGVSLGILSSLPVVLAYGDGVVSHAYLGTYRANGVSDTEALPLVPSGNTDVSYDSVCLEASQSKITC